MLFLVLYIHSTYKLRSCMVIIDVFLRIMQIVIIELDYNNMVLLETASHQYLSCGLSIHNSFI